MRVALVHDYLTHFGGAERVLEALMELYPNAPVYTLVYNRERMQGHIEEDRIRTSYLQKMPQASQAHRYFPLALMPLAVEQFDLGKYDVVLSANHSFGKGVVVKPRTLHISYCFTPIRYAWDNSHRYVKEFAPGSRLKWAAPAALTYIRMWDYMAAQRVDHFLTLSRYVGRRIKKYYRRDAEVVPPPVNAERFTTANAEGSYYLIVSRLVPYKRIELAIEACEKLGVPLKIAGTGPEEESLKQKAGKRTEFLGFVPEENLPHLYRGAKALLFPQEEDFGITPLEAAASGRPTIAFEAGGALETVKDRVTGIFFKEQTSNGLAEAIQQFQKVRFEPREIHRHAYSFRREVFMEAIDKIVQREMKVFSRGKIKDFNYARAVA